MGRCIEVGLLQPLPSLKKPCMLVLMEFINALRDVKGFDRIRIVVDRFSKYGIFISTPKNCSEEMAVEEFYHLVVKLFEILTNIMSGHDAHFIKRFWIHLFNTMGMKLKFRTTNHP